MACVHFRLTMSLLFFLVLQSVTVNAARYASIIVDEETQTVLHAYNPDLLVFPASLTKMMTLYLVFENLKSGKLKRNTILNVSHRASRQPRSKLGLKQNSKITVEQSIKALITKSANDIATVLAERVGGTEENFARIMTSRARQLSMSRTQFKNASGLPNKKQVSTARDMAFLSIALRQHFPNYFNFFKTNQFYFQGSRHKNHNKLLRRLRGTDGIKTGYIRDSGYNIAVSLKYKQRRLIGTFFGGKSAKRRDRHVIKTFKRVFKMLDQMDITDQKYQYNKTAASTFRTSGSKVNNAQTFGRNKTNQLWSVQVGAFYHFQAARRAALRASKILRHTLKSRIYIKENIRRGKRMFRARFIGMRKFKAKNVCKRLKQRNIRCLVVREQRPTAQGDR